MTNTTYSAFAFLEQLFSLINKRNVDIAYSKKKKKKSVPSASGLSVKSWLLQVTNVKWGPLLFFIFCSLNPSENLTSRLHYLLWGQWSRDFLDKRTSYSDQQTKIQEIPKWRSWTRKMNTKRLLHCLDYKRNDNIATNCSHNFLPVVCLLYLPPDQTF